MVEAGIRNVISNAKKFTNKGGKINVALQCVKQEQANVAIFH